MDATLRQQVVLRSGGQCEYCRIPQRFFTELFQIEHIVAKRHRGLTVVRNLALACARCNRHKGPNLSGIDPLSDRLTPLFNPRSDRWNEHFRQDPDGSMRGLTAIGRTTVYVLGMNAPQRVELRAAIGILEKLDHS